MVGDKLKSLREKSGKTQQELADILHISRGTYAHYEIGKRTPDIEMLRKFADFFGVSMDYITGHSAEYQQTSYIERLIASNQAIPVDGSAIRVPLVGRIHAGEPILAYEEHDEDRVFPPAYLKKGFQHIVLRVVGDCMDGGKHPIKDGYEVLVCITPEVEQGKIGVVVLPDEEMAVLRRVKYLDGQVILTADNPEYGPLFFPTDQVRFVGQVIRLSAMAL